MSCLARKYIGTIFVCHILFLATTSAQIANVDDTTATPAFGAGHDYIRMLSETVNPANGSVSLRIELPTPPGRGVSIPFSIGYDSGGVNHLVPGFYPYYGRVNWAPNTGTLSQGGWSYVFPAAGAISWQTTEGSYPTFFTCNIVSDYVFRDASGGVHPLGLSNYSSNTGTCSESWATSGGDAQYSAVLTDQTNSPPLVVYSGDGTVFQFGTVGTSNGTSQVWGQPAYIEDRNGNRIVSTSNGFTDTLGRSVIAWNGFGPTGSTNTVSVAGSTYQVTWKTTSPNYAISSTWVGSTNGPNSQYDTCLPIPAVNDSQTVISKITLPNSKTYNFYYGTDTTPHGAQPNSYGLLSEIDYPTGGWVTYSWKLSDTMNELADYPGEITEAGTTCSTDPSAYCPAPVPDGCAYQYKTPVVAARTVYFGASSPSLIQMFTYSTVWAAPLSGNVGGTSWTTKTTNVTSTDSIRAKSQLTTYTYAPISLPPQPNTHTNSATQVPVESSIAYYDWGSPGPLFRTVNKTWLNQFNLASEQTVLPTGQSSQVAYTYGPFSQVTAKDEYDFGASSPTRMTRIAYQSFAGAPGYLDDKACTVIVCSSGASCTSSSFNKMSETDYLYDGGTAVCGQSGSAITTAVGGLIAGTHDETLFAGTKSTPRGNVTQKNQWASTGSSPVTKYTYDETGQVLSKTDPCGVTQCTDMAALASATQYSYTDSYSSGTPPGQTNAYLTKLTDPLGHIATFKYGYADGQLTSSTDPNSQTTSYTYNTPPSGCSYADGLDRLSEIDYPDQGKTTYCYNDAAPSPSVQTTKLISSGVSLTNKAVMDGMGYVVQTQLTSDPDGATLVDTSYDGLGRVYTQSNPHRSGASTDGTTTNTYDALGRTIAIARPDGSDVDRSYSGNCSTVLDEAGTVRRSCSDALGRLIEVDEPGSGGQREVAGWGTVTIGTNTNGEQSVFVAASKSRGDYTIMGNPPPSLCGTGPQGTITISVNGSQVGSAPYYTTSSTGSVATALWSSINSSLVTADNPNGGPTVTVWSIATGSSTHYAVSAQPAAATGQCKTMWIVGPPNLQNGQDAHTTYDSGSVSVTVNGVQSIANYGSSDSTTTIASALAGAVNTNTSSSVTASASGGVVTLTANDAGASSNYSVSTLVTWNTSLFSQPSFTASSPGALSGGSDSTLGTGPLVTLYVYDALNNLTCAVQKGSDTTPFTSCAASSATWRPRSFVYDSLSRLTSATNPESGTITYTYDLNGNLLTRVSPTAGQTGTAQTTHLYTYDALNRLLQETHAYGTSGTVTYAYDGKTLNTGCGQIPPPITSTYPTGRRTAMCGQRSGSSWSFDKMGRPLLESTRNLGSTQKVLNVNYNYNKDGSLNTLTYPSGDIVTYTVGGAGRATQVSDSTNNFVTGASYAPPGMLTGMTNGTGIVTSNIYNDRLQPILLSAGVNGQTPLFRLCYDFHLHVGINNTPCSFPANTATGDNGNVFQVINTVDSTRSTTYTYDPLNRISQANTNSTTGPNCWGEAYTIDSWGNLTNRAGVSGMGGCLTEGLSATPTTKNQLNGIGLQYDAAGNVTTDNLGNTPTYDAENRISTVAGFSYFYDADGTRMEKAAGSSGTMYWLGASGETLSESDLAGTINEEYIFFNGKRIARVDRPSGTVHYYFSNHLGSHTVVTNAVGNCEQDIEYYPYGGVIADHCATVAQHYKFTGKERDSESGLDNFDFRYFGSSMGRFMSADDGSDQDADNPQSWNLYSYVRNNPLKYTDPDGHDCIYIDNDSGKMTGFNRGDCDNSTEEKANSGVYVNGTVNSIELNGQDQVTGYSGTGDQFGVFTMGVIQPPGAAPPPQVNDPGMIPGMLGPGDLILFSGVKLPSVVTDAVGKLVGSILGKGAQQGAEQGVELTTHAATRLAQRGITQATVDEAVQTAKAAGQVTTQMGKYGTQQLVYKGTNGVTVIVETQGSNAGKAITVFQTGSKP